MQSRHGFLPTPMSTATRLLTSDLWATASKLAAKSSTRFAAIAYVTAEHVRFKKGDVLICDASEWQVRRGATSAPVLLAARKRGAEIRDCPNLHAKVLLLDDRVIIGSANLSATSADDLEECAVLSSDPALLSQTKGYLHQLRETSRPLERSDLEKLAALPVEKQPAPLRAGHKRTPPPGNRCWIVGLRPLDDDDLSSVDLKAKETGRKAAGKSHPGARDSLEWFRISGTSKFRSEAKPGDRVLVLMPSSDGSSKLIAYKPLTLLATAPGDKCDFYYYDDTESPEESGLPAQKVQRLLVKSGAKIELKPRMIREIPGALFDFVTAVWDDERVRAKVE